MVSDDTEYACLVAHSLIASAGNEEAFLRDLACRRRWWLLGLPAGAGPEGRRCGLRSALVRSLSAQEWCLSVGNGPAMRAAILGAAVEDIESLRSLIHTSTRLTHSDPRAEAGALAIALAARTARREPNPDGREFLATMRSALADSSAQEQLLDRLALAIESASQGETTPAFAGRLQWARGVSGYINDTAPAVIHAWLRHPADLRVWPSRT